MPLCPLCKRVFSSRWLRDHVCSRREDGDDDQHPPPRRDQEDAVVRDRSASPVLPELNEEELADAILHPDVDAPAPPPPGPVAVVHPTKFDIAHDLPRSTFAFICILKLWSITFNVSAKAFAILLLILSAFISTFPSLSCFKINKRLHLDDDRFLELVVCSQCNMLYPMRDCIDHSINPATGRPRNTALTCAAVRWPFHPQAHHRKRCNADLIQKKAGKWQPIVSFHHLSLRQRLGEMLRRSDVCILLLNHLTRCCSVHDGTSLSHY